MTRLIDQTKGYVHEWYQEPMRRVALRAKLMEPLRRLQFASFGSKSIIHKPTWLYGTNRIAIGEWTVLLTGMWLSAERGADDDVAPSLIIGDRVWMRPFCTVSATESVIIEDDVLCGANVTIIDSNHTWKDGVANALFNRSDSAPTRVGRGTWIADRAAVLAGADIGEQCIIGANSVVKGVIPDYSIAVGAPARVVGTTRALEAPVSDGE